MDWQLLSSIWGERCSFRHVQVHTVVVWATAAASSGDGPVFELESDVSGRCAPQTCGGATVHYIVLYGCGFAAGRVELNEIFASGTV